MLLEFRHRHLVLLAFTDELGDKAALVAGRDLRQGGHELKKRVHWKLSASSASVDQQSRLIDGGRL